MTRADWILKSGLVRPPIRETLALRTFNCKRRTVAIVEAECGSVVVAKIVVSKIPMQMFLAAMLIDTAHASFKNRKVILG